ncbi:MAG TPA: sensor histidine kinase [Accumulibacter sp.]|nr:sensor histidine kinase [Accumulibacter sp.]HQC81533.1 sensor histidine kinase [Accumulibacter sp.]
MRRGYRLDNALRYTLADSPVVVADRQNGDVLLGVLDAGPGGVPDELPRLVERFYRGSEARVEGSGLGLTIARRIAETHRARLDVENRAGGGLAAFLRWRGAAQVSETSPGR